MSRIKRAIADNEEVIILAFWLSVFVGVATATVCSLSVFVALRVNGSEIHTATLASSAAGIVLGTCHAALVAANAAMAVLISSRPEKRDLTKLWGDTRRNLYTKPLDSDEDKGNNQGTT